MLFYPSMWEGMHAYVHVILTLITYIHDPNANTLLSPPLGPPSMQGCKLHDITTHHPTKPHIIYTIILLICGSQPLLDHNITSSKNLLHLLILTKQGPRKGSRDHSINEIATKGFVLFLVI